MFDEREVRPPEERSGRTTDKRGGRRPSERGGRPTDGRAVAPVVGKALEAGIVVLFIGLLGSTLYGGLVPDYRTAAGAEVGERALAESAQRVQQAVPPNATRVRVRERVTLPRTIRGEPYRIRVDESERELVLVHPHDGVGGRVRLALPASVASVEGEWSSREPALIVVTNADDGLAVQLRSEDP